MPSVPPGTVRAGCAWPHPSVSRALQVGALMTTMVGPSPGAALESLAKFWLPTYRVPLRRSSASGIGKLPTATVGCDSAQPTVLVALHVRRSIIETVLSSALVTY